MPEGAMAEKHLSESGWKALSSKRKVRDLGLGKALATYGRTADDPTARLAALDEIERTAERTSKDKSALAAPDVADFLDGLVKEAAKARGVAASLLKAAQKQVEQDQRAKTKDDAPNAGGDDEVESGDLGQRLLDGLARVRKGRGEVAYPFLVGVANPTYGLIVAKRITPKHKQDLKELAGATKFLPVGQCLFESGKFAFVMEQANAALGRKLTEAIKQQTGKKFPVVLRDLDGATVLDDSVETPIAADAAADASAAKAPRHAVDAAENEALAELDPEELAKADLAQRDPKELFTESYMDKLVGMKVDGAGQPALKDVMRELDKAVTGAKRKKLIAQLAVIRKRDAKTLDAEYGRFLVLREQQDAVRKKHAKEGNDPEAVSGLNEGVHGKFMASNPQLVFGKVIGDAFGIDAVFGAMLSPTGGMVGPGNKALQMDDDDPTGYHGIVHDAAGYLFNYHDQGPGYNYLGREKRDTSDPLTGQQEGMRYWHKKLDPGVMTEVLTAHIDVAYGVYDAVLAAGAAKKEVGKAIDKAKAEVDKAMQGARDSAAKAIDDARNSASVKAGEAKTALEKAARDAADGAAAAKARLRESAVQKYESARAVVGEARDAAKAKLDAAWNYLRS
jgi:hypothetical protein